MAVLGFSVLALVVVILAIVIYIQTKSLKKIGYFLEIILSLGVLILSSKLLQLTSADKALFAIVIFLGTGLLINGVVSLLKK